MPPTALSTTPVLYSAYSAVADNELGEIVTHIAVLSNSQSLVRGSSASVLHQSPPLKVPSPEDRPSTMQVRLVSELPLSKAQAEMVGIWLSRTRKQMPRNWKSQYVVVPAISVVRGDGGVEIFRRYSCAGFVLDLYESGAGVQLIPNWQSGELPLVDAATVSAVWQRSLDRYDGETLAERLANSAADGVDLGISGQGPWPILLPGYVMKAIANGVQGLPSPTLADAKAMP